MADLEPCSSGAPPRCGAPWGAQVVNHHGGAWGAVRNLKPPPTEKPENAADKSFRGGNLHVLSSWKQG